MIRQKLNTFNFIFFILRYVKGGVLGYNNIGTTKWTTTFLWVLNLDKLGSCPSNYENHPRGDYFFKKSSQLHDP